MIRDFREFFRPFGSLKAEGRVRDRRRGARRANQATGTPQASKPAAMSSQPGWGEDLFPSGTPASGDKASVATDTAAHMTSGKGDRA